ncbi:dihydropteroate synthase [Kribbella sp. VKM Ac-2527]|uniref:Dihydropteroate synthase n=1 Tax=Kribbella caucasensis TaxID=2512215 RepID=A0A4R6KNP0_9ACTN|nr:dihydropteroate synthase [Kribbella sp. VKM Ac-2527]TDO54256.1 dihydropteroate synthase [Kribbella sp. VKM Ac-2527]
MGVVNVTPDSFSDGGEWFEPSAAIKHGRELLAEGADLLDVGGESTRPGAERPAPAEEIRRVLPVIETLAAEGALISVDTMRSEVAALALDAGAVMVNDVSGGLADPDMLGLVADRRAAYLCMHWRGHSTDMQSRAVYDDVVAEVIAELAERLEAIRVAGIDLARVAIDPGLGFAKNADHNWTMLRRLHEFAVLERPILIGASRKTFLGRLLADEETGEPRPAVRRDDASAAVSALAAASGAWCVRAHAVAPSADAVRVARRWGAG